MTQIVLSLMLGGYLSLAPPAEASFSRRRKQLEALDIRVSCFSDSRYVPTLPKQVLILDELFEPPCVYIRVDDAVFVLSLQAFGSSSVN